MDNFYIMTNMNKFISFLHKSVYIDSDLVGILEQCISEQFEVSSISLTSPMRFELKIKKTNIKKEKNYSHTALFYYDKIDAAFNSFFSNTSVKHAIENGIEDVEDPFEQNIIRDIFSKILAVSDIKPISLVYTVTPVLDNIIFINI